MGMVTHVVTQGPALRRVLHLFYCFPVAMWEFLIIPSLNLCFVTEVQSQSIGASV